MKAIWIALLLLVAAPVAAGEMYSWTDANGVKHFSDSPPPKSVKAEKLHVRGGVTTSTPAEDEEADAKKAAGPAMAAAAGYSEEDIKRNCAMARQNLATLEAQKPAVDAEGYPVDLDAAKHRQGQIDKANQQIKLFCTSQ
ncbi:MAG: DUF4124 domain-containing protein [Dokdonella sp.]|uniref:DUF4124 domain-containing protein n=1 Tax=Dokdonella sp. TaxID=2291710 RepID=UPI0025C33DDA|nr:DUF4124 domain-containing protein [Dokdonella sp.]MBX3700269.1 DUF4124 domain-containing protein [Dokdonella sp.]MCW5577028.1 DUF4124 domain-containing protein [Dokdonella sp.]